jgi:hypothetical protein
VVGNIFPTGDLFALQFQLSKNGKWNPILDVGQKRPWVGGSFKSLNASEESRVIDLIFAVEGFAKIAN